MINNILNLIGTQILAQSCKNASDCTNLNCATKIKCEQNKCQCLNERYVRAISLKTRCNVQSCIDLCKSKGEVIYVCVSYRCYCRKPPM
ncbi:defensin-like protein 306 [Arabidopsis lyrata subsp. lyrata]|uniref:defensin-like protein 306 n=1 Tax=Arabidopsis lyrata subsp. lyrata TaxID=81972 RepID=UPI000A29C5C8|nr:defensin-like protein 306 [Arabidopsis lyrata subsp. lyrata]|eukprot:XP_020872735.1 defensin-like protein 306 [Arabidopsis lyrata subsp. lyrata]